MYKIWLLLPLIFLFYANSAAAQTVTVFAPSQAEVELKSENPEKNGASKIASPAAEVDLLLTLMDPSEGKAQAIEMPQMLAALIHGPKTDTGEAIVERRDLLGDMEEIEYQGQKAWGVNVAVDKPGLYQFILDARPRWDEERNTFILTHAKIILPALGAGIGWEQAAGQNLEIIPLNRPFGLTAPALFSGKVLFQGKACANVEVSMGCISDDKIKAPTQWHKVLVARSDEQGKFAFVLNQPGWWYCQASMAADPLKGADGALKNAKREAILWFYVDRANYEKSNGKNNGKDKK